MQRPTITRCALVLMVLGILSWAYAQDDGQPLEGDNAAASKPANVENLPESSDDEAVATSEPSAPPKADENAAPADPPPPAAGGGDVPVSEPDGTSAPARPILPDDGTLVANQRCHLVADGNTGWYFAKFDDAPGLVDCYVQPSQRLGEMLRVLKKKPKAEFVVYGQTMNYKDKAFILIRLAMVLTRTQAPTTEPTTTTSGPSTTTTSTSQSTTTTTTSTSRSTTTQGTTTQGTTTLSTSRPAKPLTPEEIMKRLLAKETGRPIISPEPKILKQRSPIVPDFTEQLPRAFGDIVADRVIRVELEKEGDMSSWMVAKFESNNHFQEQPIRLLPCRLLASIERFPNKKLRVSGEIVKFAGREYLILRKVLPERDMGQF